MPQFVPYLHLFLRWFFLLSKALSLSQGTWTRAQELSQSITSPLCRPSHPLPPFHFHRSHLCDPSASPPSTQQTLSPTITPEPPASHLHPEKSEQGALSTANISEGANPQSIAVSTQNQRQFSTTSGSARDSERKALARPRANSRQNAHACT